MYNGLKNSDGFVVGDFDNVINDYAKIIKCVNNKFGKNFDLYDKTEENENTVRHIVQNQDELKNAADYGERVAYPNEDRKKMLTEIKNRLLDPRYKYEYRKCEKLYNTFLSRSCID